MATGKNEKYPDVLIRDLESQISNLKFELEEARALLLEEQEDKQFYQLVADFAIGWELWFGLSGKIKYCSPSCMDLTGYSANQVMGSPTISELLVYKEDREIFETFIAQALDQALVNTALEFRILTRTRQLRWCVLNVRGVYTRKGRYLGIRASVQDITRLKRALGQISSFSASKEMENRTRQRLKSELEMKEREMVSFLLQLSQKNEWIARVRRQIKRIFGEDSSGTDEEKTNLLHLMQNPPDGSVDWDMIEVQIEKIYPGFMGRLLLKHPKLTPKEKKLCACLRLGLTSKEIAGLNNHSSKSVEIARVRIRKKLKIKHEIRLSNYLLQI